MSLALCFIHLALDRVLPDVVQLSLVALLSFHGLRVVLQATKLLLLLPRQLLLPLLLGDSVLLVQGVVGLVHPRVGVR